MAHRVTPVRGCDVQLLEIIKARQSSEGALSPHFVQGGAGHFDALSELSCHTRPEGHVNTSHWGRVLGGFKPLDCYPPEWSVRCDWMQAEGIPPMSTMNIAAALGLAVGYLQPCPAKCTSLGPVRRDCIVCHQERFVVAGRSFEICSPEYRVMARGGSPYLRVYSPFFAPMDWKLASEIQSRIDSGLGYDRRVLDVWVSRWVPDGWKREFLDFSDSRNVYFRYTPPPYVDLRIPDLRAM